MLLVHRPGRRCVFSPRFFVLFCFAPSALEPIRSGSFGFGFGIYCSIYDYEWRELPVFPFSSCNKRSAPSLSPKSVRTYVTWENCSVIIYIYVRVCFFESTCSLFFVKIFPLASEVQVVRTVVALLSLSLGLHYRWRVFKAPRSM